LAPAALFAEPVTQLHEAIDRLAQEDLELVPASSLGDDLRGLRSAIERMEAEFSGRLERFDRNQGYVITRSAEQVGCEALRDAEPILLEAARRLDARQLRYVTAQLRHCLDPDGTNY